ncbi:MAG: ABC transporter permease [Candidatus Zixiibacteriota bacterium]|nr:MAG: ABC transporter permease [candidate division Zixibacteria bacterium]
MLKSYLKTALRNLTRNKIHTAINISGLAIGIACCLLLLLHVQNELSYDKFHAQHQQIYRMYQINRDPNGNVWTRSITGSAPGVRLKDDFPQIEAVVRFVCSRNLVSVGDKKIYEDRFFYADDPVFDVFSFKLTVGDPSMALREPYSIALSESAARKYFGSGDPMGKTININNRADYTVTGVFEDVPQRSHLQFDFLASLRTITSSHPVFNDDWQNATRTYVLLSEGADPAVLESAMPVFIRKYQDEEAAASLNYGLQPLADIHLNPTSVDLEGTTSAAKLYLFGALAVFILLIAVINFVNLSTAQYARRVGEVSVRKVLGATRDQIRQQFMAESMVLAFIASALALVLVELFLPVFRGMIQTNFEIHYARNPLALIGLLGLALLVGLIGGFYPSMVLSRHNPADILRKTFKSGRGGVYMRRALVVFQFAISAALILSVLVVHGQYSFLSDKDLGFKASGLVKIPLESSMLGRLPDMKEKLSVLPGVHGVTASTFGYDYGFNTHPQADPKVRHLVVIFADHDFIRTMGLKVIQGRDFSENYPGDQSRAIIFNRRTLDVFGDGFSVGENLLGYQGKLENNPPNAFKTVVGTVENFHFRDITEQGLQPMALVIDQSRYENLLIRVDDTGLSATIASIGKVYAQFFPDRPFEFSFLEDELQQVVAGELRQSTILGYSCLLAVFVALIGLFGLALHMTQQRTKEIGIRKVCGASSHRIVSMLTVEFALLVIAANIIALPVAYYFLSEWLRQYPNRVEFGATYFAVAAVACLLLALGTVSYQSLKAAGANPVDALRYE